MGRGRLAPGISASHYVHFLIFILFFGSAIRQIKGTFFLVWFHAQLSPKKKAR